MDLLYDAPTQAGIRGTARGAYQAVVEYVDHHAPVRTRHDPAAAANARALRLLTSDEPTKTKRTAWTRLATST